MKHSAYPEGRRHIQDIKKNVGPLSRALNGRLISPVDVLSATQDAISFPYVTGKTLEDTLLEAIAADDRAKTIAIIQSLTRLFKGVRISNPSRNPAYTAVFGDTFNRYCICYKPGVIDTNLDNIIVSQAGDWLLIDYEWVFDFAVPREFIIKRMIYYFFGPMNGAAIKQLASESMPVKQLADNLFVPLYLYRKFKKLFRGFDRIILTENHFQLYVSKPGIEITPHLPEDKILT